MIPCTLSPALVQKRTVCWLRGFTWVKDRFEDLHLSPSSQTPGEKDRSHFHISRVGFGVSEGVPTVQLCFHPRQEALLSDGHINI